MKKGSPAAGVFVGQPVFGFKKQNSFTCLPKKSTKNMTRQKKHSAEKYPYRGLQ
jgi:hypothetical protein